MPQFTRRTMLSAAATLAATGVLRAQETGPRIATLDWALLETLLAIGANVVAATELRQFRQVAVKPDVPEGVTDLGLRGTPNFEALRFARPDLIFNSNFYAWADPLMSRIAPVETHSIYKPGESPYVLAGQATLAIGERLRRPQPATWSRIWQAGSTAIEASLPGVTAVLSCRSTLAMRDTTEFSVPTACSARC